MSRGRQPTGTGLRATARHAAHNWRTRAEVQLDWRSRMPDFIVIGTARGGSSSLFRYLREAPGLVPATRKEVNFFNRDYDRGRYWYAARFSRRRPGTLHFEATPTYLHWPEAPSRVRALAPQCRFVVLLRDPVRRAISHIQLRQRNGREKRSLEEVIERELADPLADVRDRARWKSAPAYLYLGLYERHLERWFADFPPERFFIAASEQLWAPDGAKREQLMAWLGAAPPDGGFPPSRGPQPPSSPPSELVEQLRDFYRAPNERLCELLGWRPEWA